MQFYLNKGILKFLRTALKPVLVAGLAVWTVLTMSGILPRVEAGNVVVVRETNSVTLPDNIVSWWRMDETTGTTMTDVAGNNNGTAVNGVGHGYKGVLSNAYVFDGSNDYVSVADPTDGSLDFGTGDFTLSAWVYKYPGSTTRSYIINKFYDTGSWYAGYGIAWDQNNQIVWYISSSGSGTGQYTTGSYSTNQWHLITLTRSSGTAYLYVDGVLDNSLSANYNVDSSYAFSVGRNTGGNNYFFNGMIDDVRAYNVALSASDVASLYNNGAQNIGGDNDAEDSNLVLLLPFDETSGSTATDYSSSTTNGTLGGDTLVNQTGVYGKAYSFDGTGDYVSMGDILDSTFTGATATFSLTAWIKSDDTTTANDMIIAKYGDGGCSPTENQRAFFLRLYNGGIINFYMQESLDSGTTYSLTTPSGSITQSEWHNVVTTVDMVNDAVKIYIDGVLQDSTLSGSMITSIEDSSDPLIIGGACDQGETYNFDGTIDEVRIYDDILNADEVWNLARREKDKDSLVGYWQLDEPSGTTAYDSSGNDFNGTTSGATVNQTGVLGKAYSFDGSGDYIAITDDNALQPQNLTVSAWIKPSVAYTSASSFSGFVIKNQNNSNANGKGFYLGYYPGQISWWAAETASWRGAGYTTDLAANQWYHVTGTYDGTTYKLYLDGSLVASTSYSNTITYDTSPVWIGRSFNNSGNVDFNGVIDDVRIYDRVLPANEVLDLSLEDSYLTYNLDETSGSVSFNSGGQGTSNGTITGATVGVTGQVGQAYSFDGSGDYVDYGDVSGIDGATTLTTLALAQRDSTSEVGGVVSKYGSGSNRNFAITGTSNSFQVCMDTVNDAVACASAAGSPWTDTSNFHQVGFTYNSDDGTSSVTEYGDGGDGALTVSTAYNINSNGGTVTNVTAISTNSVTVGSVSGFSSGDKAMLINMRGDSTNYGNVGNYEILDITSAAGTTVTFSSNISKIYGATTSNSTLTGQSVMLQRIPQYTNVTINNGGYIVPSAWNGTTGGVVAFLANGTVTINSGGYINVWGYGYRGGAATASCGSTPASQGESYSGGGVVSASANGGGGGGAPYWSAGGGSYGTAGTGATGATYGVADLSDIYLGSGGGGSNRNDCSGWSSQNGFAGGGIVYIGASTITLGGYIYANGAGGSNGYPYIPSGAGSGGSVYLKGGTVTLGSNLVTALTGTCASGYSCNAGGSGRVAVYYANSISGTTTPSATTATFTPASNTSGELKFYFDGALSTTTSAFSGALETGSDPLRIGSYYDTLTDQIWNGDIDLVKIYTRVLSATQIDRLYDRYK